MTAFLGYETFSSVGVFSFVYICLLVLNKFTLRLPSDWVLLDVVEKVERIDNYSFAVGSNLWEGYMSLNGNVVDDPWYFR